MPVNVSAAFMVCETAAWLGEAVAVLLLFSAPEIAAPVWEIWIEAGEALDGTSCKFRSWLSLAVPSSIFNGTETSVNPQFSGGRTVSAWSGLREPKMGELNPAPAAIVLKDNGGGVAFLLFCP